MEADTWSKGKKETLWNKAWCCDTLITSLSDIIIDGNVVRVGSEVRNHRDWPSHGKFMWNEMVESTTIV